MREPILPRRDGSRNGDSNPSKGIPTPFPTAGNPCTRRSACGCNGFRVFQWFVAPPDLGRFWPTHVGHPLTWIWSRIASRLCSPKTSLVAHATQLVHTRTGLSMEVSHSRDRGERKRVRGTVSHTVVGTRPAQQKRGRLIRQCGNLRKNAATGCRLTGPRSPCNRQSRCESESVSRKNFHLKLIALPSRRN